MKGSPAAIAHMEQLVAYHKDPAKAPHRNPPKPPSPEVAWELMAQLNQLAAIMLDYTLTGELHPDNPCPEAILAAAELADKAMDGKLEFGDCEEVARRFERGSDGG